MFITTKKYGNAVCRKGPDPKSKIMGFFQGCKFFVGNCRLTLADHIEEIVVVIVGIQSLHENKIDFL